MSKSTELDQAVKCYILENIDGSNYDRELTTIQEKIDFLHEIFLSEYGWRVQQVGELQAMIDWLQGLGGPSIAFYNDDILQLAKAWKSLPEYPTEKQEQKILDNYWNLIANKILQLFRGYRVPKGY